MGAARRALVGGSGRRAAAGVEEMLAVVGREEGWDKVHGSDTLRVARAHAAVRRGPDADQPDLAAAVVDQRCSAWRRG